LIDKTSSIYLYVKLKALASWIFLSFTSFKVKHATPRNKWSVCWSSSSITYLSPLEGNCFSRSSAYQWVRIVPLF
jgi:hypothetical protein